MNSKHKALYETFKFSLKLLLLSLPFYILIPFLDLSFLQEITLINVKFLLELMGFGVKREGFMLILNNGFNFLISADCTAWKSMVFIAALMISTPSISLRKKAFGIVGGFFILWVGNIARITLLVFVQRYYGNEVMGIIHNYLWQLGLILLVLITWISWIFISKRD